MMNDALSSIMTQKVITVAPTDNLLKVRIIFLENKLHHIPVTEGNKLVGIITTADLWKLEKCYTDYAEMSVNQVMTTKIAKLLPTDKIGVAAELFLENKFHAVPIVEGDTLVGIVSSFDVMSYSFRKAYPRQFD